MIRRASPQQMIARAVVSPYWENGRRASLSGRLAGTTLVELQFLLDGRPLSGTPSWAEAPSLIAPAIAGCLRNLRRKSEAIVLSVRGFPSHRRRVNGRTIELPSEAEIYLDYVLARRIENYQWITRSDQDSIRSELICEVPGQWLAGVIRAHWEWHSISGYLLPRRDVPRALDWPVQFRSANWKRRRAEELAIASVFFEDWADGTALRLWSKVVDEPTLRARMILPRVNRPLRRVSLRSDNRATPKGVQRGKERRGAR
jgi:hypothetical protein